MAQNVQKHLSHFYIQIDGTELPAEMQNNLLEVRVENSLTQPDVASLIFEDPRLEWVDHPLFAPGKALEVRASSAGNSGRIFDGEIVGVEPEYGAGSARMVVQAFDRLHKLSRGSQVRSFNNVTDEDIVKKIASEMGLSSKVAATPTVHDYVCQDNESNLSFLRKRAAQYGYVVYVRDKTLHFGPPQTPENALELGWQSGLSEFRPRVSTSSQPTETIVRGWDPKNKRSIESRSSTGEGQPEGVWSGGQGGEVSGEAFNQRSPSLAAGGPVRSQKMADQLVQAQSNVQSGQFIQAEGSTGGNPQMLAGSKVAVGGVGDRFSGDYVVSSATHTYRPETGYTTEFSVAAHTPQTVSNLIAQQTGAQGGAGGSSSASGSGAQGLAIAIVTNNDDPSGLGRVKVKFPHLSDGHESDWARTVILGGGNTRGMQFLPEVNDEVLVGFEQGDVHHPYVLGGLWNGQDAAPKPGSEVVKSGKVVERIIRSRTGHLLSFDDSDDAPKITIQDKNGNLIVIDSKKNELRIEMKGGIKIKAGEDIVLEASKTLELKAMQVKITAEGTVDVQGNPIKLN